ncbi:MAG: FtsW/RodA/SpoVE family cell cycle protein [Eubacteriales bacterium]|nr:FtsW/RodA/SpoVE family cell cycle protein [Eubacteriales bacterium]
MVLERRGAGALLTFIIIFLISACALLSFREGSFDAGIAAYGLGAALLMLLAYNLAALIFRHIDRITLVICFFLTSIGLVMLLRLDMELAIKQLIWLGLGCLILFFTVVVIKKARDFGRINYLLMAASFGLLLFAYVLGDTIGGAKNWVNLGPISFQPSEIAKVMFIIVSAYFFAERRGRGASVFYAAYVGLCVILLVLSNDLGAALLYCGTFLIVFFAGTGRTLLTVMGLGVGAAGAIASYYVIPHVKTRVEIWQNPWIYYQTQGYQIVQGLMAIAAGGAFGTGLGLGYPEAVPVNTSDYIFAAICEEFGIVFGIITILLYLVFIIRGMIIARNASSRFDALLVFGATCMLSLQSFIIIGGVIKLIPLTGITLPFISAGGSSFIACMCLVGIIEGVAVKNGERDEREINEAGGEVV